MGVSGAGRTTVAPVLAARLGPMQEGDNLHPAANVATMQAGHPLDDADRRPWPASVASWVGEQERAGRALTGQLAAPEPLEPDELLVPDEPLEPDEPRVTVNAGGSAGDAVETVLAALARDHPSTPRRSP